MIEIPNYYKNTIITMFGDKGHEWLDKLPDLIIKYINDFALTDIKVLDNLTYNIVLFANAKEYGAVILKIGLPENELLIREITALSHFKNGACKCLYGNQDDGVLLLERIIPGDSLNIVNSQIDRIKVLHQVATNLHRNSELPSNLPTYSEIFNRSLINQKNNPQKYLLIDKYLTQAHDYLNEIEKQDLPDILLHADLHTNNIIKNNNEWKAIDPHGFIGKEYYEPIRFIEHEILENDLNKDDIINIVNNIAEYFHYPQDLILKALYLDFVLTISWDIEINTSIIQIEQKIRLINIIEIILAMSNTISYSI